MLAAGLGLGSSIAEAAQPVPSTTFVGTIPAAKPVVKSNAALASRPSPPGAATVPEGEGGPPLVRTPARPPVIDPAVQFRAAGSGSDLQDLSIDQLSDPDQYGGLSYIQGIDSGSNPPDTVMDVGPDHIVQMTNGTSWQVWDKKGNDLTGVLGFSNLWPLGDPCRSNLGDPIVVYDHLADRWLLSQFARNAAKTQFWMCIAISQTPSPLPAAGYYVYTIEVPVFPDYPKFGVWPNAYYMTSYEGGDLGVFAFDRALMLTGAATSFVKKTISSLSGSRRNTRILPADLDGPPAPDGTPGFFFRSVDDLQDLPAGAERLEVYEFVVDWNNIGAASFNLVDTLTPAAFETFDCDRSSSGDPDTALRDCIPQPNTTATLDALSNRAMMQLKFRNFGGDFRMVVNQTVDVGGSLANTLNIPSPGEVAGVRWYELQKSGGPNWTIRQQGTYASQPIGATTAAQLVHRWMGSAAMDRFGNIAIGYSIVNDDDSNPLFPGIRYTGRAAGDPFGTMPQGEKVIYTGTTSQGADGAFGQRWGDYSTLSVDPADDCTFFYTTHVSNGDAPSRTKIGSFRFADCGVDLGIVKTASPVQGVAGQKLTYNIAVTNYSTLTAEAVLVKDTLPTGTTYFSDTLPDPECTRIGQNLQCGLGALAPGQTTSFQIVVDTDPNLLATTNSVTNTATVESEFADPNLSNNSSSVTTIFVARADLAVTKTCKPDQPAPAGSAAFCDIVVTNLGPSAAQDVVLTDTIVSNASFTVTSATAAPIPCNPLIATPIGPTTAATLTCNLGTVAAGAATTFHVEFSSTSAGDVNDTATVTSSTPDPNTANNTATGRVSFAAVADVSVTKTAAPNPVIAGTNLTYTINVGNAGPSAAANVVVKDTVPADVAVLTVTPSVGSCTAGIPGNPLQPTTCTLGTLSALGNATIVVVVKVSPSVPHGTVLNNNATVTSAAADPNNANNSATAAVTVNASADLAIVKTSDKPQYKPSSDVTYTVMVSNLGPSDAQAVVVTDNLPTAQQALYQSDTGGCTRNLQTPTLLTCNLGTVPVGTSRSFNVYELIHGSRGEVSNTASVASATGDPAPANNSSTVVVIIGK
jgi:uncharacterized repeat protein (TIGR01451 family)